MVLFCILCPDFGGDYPIVQYADDTLSVMHADPRQLASLKEILQTFATSTGLKVNFNKSFLIPINVDESKWGDLTEAFGCQLGSMPFTYLGLPLSTTRPSVQEFMPILTRMEKRLMGIFKLLTYAGRLILVNLVFSALPTFYMFTPKIPIQILDQIDSKRKHVLWHGGNVSKKGGYLVAWATVYRSKDKGVQVLLISGHRILPCYSNTFTNSITNWTSPRFL